MITCSFQIFVKYAQIFSEDSFKILIELFLYEPIFLLSRMFISLKISSDVVSENWKSSLILIVSFIEKTLGWFWDFFIAISTGSSKFSVSVRRDLFYNMKRV